MIKMVVEYFGGVAETARLLGVSQPAVSQWLKHNRIPPARAVQIEVLTKGKFKAADILQGGKDGGR
ncbi:MAG: Cro/CI family transcriptional regulator [Kiritimatiellia bacterium]